MSLYTMVGGDGNEYGPVSADDLRSWVKQGRANAQTRVKPEGGDWQTLGSVPEFASLFGGQGAAVPRPMPTPSPSSPTLSPHTSPYSIAGGGSASSAREAVLSILEPLSRATGWMKFMAIIMFVFCGLYVLATFGIGIIIMWIPLWQGVLLWKAAARINAAMVDGSEMTAEAAMGYLKTYFVLLGVLTLIGMLFMVAGMILALVGGFAFDPAQFQNY